MEEIFNGAIRDKHLNRYLAGFSTRHNICCLDTVDQMAYIAESTIRRRFHGVELQGVLESPVSLPYS